MMRKPDIYSPKQQLKLYLIHKAQKELGADAVSSVGEFCDENGRESIQLCFYVDSTVLMRRALDKAQDVFKDNLFQGDNVSGNITVELFPDMKGGYICVGEQVYYLQVHGNAKDILGNIRAGDEAGFAEAMTSQRARVILDREEVIPEDSKGFQVHAR